MLKLYMLRHVLLKNLIKPKFTLTSAFTQSSYSFVTYMKSQPKMKTNSERDFQESPFDEEQKFIPQEKKYMRNGISEFRSEMKQNTSSRFINSSKMDLNKFQPRDPSLKKDVDIVFSEYCEKHVTLTTEEEAIFYQENLIKIKSEEKIPKPLVALKDLRVEERLQRHFSSNFQTPTPIQSITWPIAQSGRNLVGVAETGSGKTLSFVLPALNHIHNQNPKPTRDGPIVLIIAPTRELANQIHTVARDYGQKLGIRTACVYGGTSKLPMAKLLQQGVELVVATPGRLLDLMNFGDVNLNRTSFVVLDEADRMLDMGFERDLRKILSKVHPKAQMLMWSATWPKEIVALAEEFLKKYVHVKIGKNENGLAINNRIKQNFIFCEPMEKKEKFDQLLQFLENENEKECEETKIRQINKLPKCIVFTNQKYKCDTLVHQLKRLGYKADSINGDKSQNERDYAIMTFRKSSIEVLVATDVAARGLDINDVKVVINYDFPNNIEDYVHRIGRTGRSGKTGVSYAFFGQENYGVIKPLISLLEKAGQEIPTELETMTGNSRSGRGSSRMRGGARSGSYRGSHDRGSYNRDFSSRGSGEDDF